MAAANQYDRQIWQEVIAGEIAKGISDENELTDAVFDRLYPRWKGRSLDAAGPGLQQEWLEIRDTLVQPVFEAQIQPLACDDKGLPKPGPIRELTRGRINCKDRKDAVRILSKVIPNAIQMLDNTIAELVRAREAACRGEPLGWPNLGDVTACWLKYRLGVCIEDTSVWTRGTYESRTVAEVIRRLVRPRNLLASNAITYLCDTDCPTGWNARVFVTDEKGNCLRTPDAVIHLCNPFWDPGHARFREQTVIHEAVHLTHCAPGAEDTAPRASIGSPECLAQFVVATNGKPLDPDFVDRCVYTAGCGAVPKACRTAPAQKPALPDWQPRRPK